MKEVDQEAEVDQEEGEARSRANRALAPDREEAWEEEEDLVEDREEVEEDLENQPKEDSVWRRRHGRRSQGDNHQHCTAIVNSTSHASLLLVILTKEEILNTSCCICMIIDGSNYFYITDSCSTLLLACSKSLKVAHLQPRRTALVSDKYHCTPTATPTPLPLYISCLPLSLFIYSGRMK